MANTNSIDFELASSQKCLASDSASLSPAASMTVELWVKFEDDPTTNGMTFIEKDKTGGADLSYRLNQTSADALTFAFSTDGSYEAENNAAASWTPSVATWYHIAAVYDNTGPTTTFYVDGAQIGTTVTISGTAIFNGTSDLNFAHGPNLPQYLDGRVDEMRIWSEARTASDILNNMNRELAGNETNLSAYWQFNGGYTDKTGNNNTFTPANTPTFPTDVPFVGAAGLDLTSKRW